MGVETGESTGAQQVIADGVQVMAGVEVVELAQAKGKALRHVIVNSSAQCHSESRVGNAGQRTGGSADGQVVRGVDAGAVHSEQCMRIRGEFVRGMRRDYRTEQVRIGTQARQTGDSAAARSGNGRAVIAADVGLDAEPFVSIELDCVVPAAVVGFNPKSSGGSAKSAVEY